jgi:methionyl-tRNA synthetase
MIARYQGGELAVVDGAPPWDAAALRDELVAWFDAYDITQGLEAIWTFIRRLNRYVEEQAPWNLAKAAGRAADLDRVLYNLADGLTAVAVAVSPYLPETAPRILVALGQPVDALLLDRIRNGTARPASGIEPAPPLFPRIDVSDAAA